MATTSPLRQRMIEDMMVRNLSPSTQQSYIYAIAKFSRHFGYAPRAGPRLPAASHRPKAFVVPHQSGGLSAAVLLRCGTRADGGIRADHRWPEAR